MNGIVAGLLTAGIQLTCLPVSLSWTLDPSMKPAHQKNSNQPDVHVTVDSSDPLEKVLALKTFGKAHISEILGNTDFTKRLEDFTIIFRKQLRTKISDLTFQ